MSFISAVPHVHRVFLASVLQVEELQRHSSGNPMLLPNMSVTVETSMIMSNIQRIIQVRVMESKAQPGELVHAPSADVLPFQNLSLAPRNSVC